ncbi:MAG: peptidoglycan-binding protein [Actinomycetota bacterium]|nr:peptidoglycan-binding protein [Actinomycetota bacterium]
MVRSIRVSMDTVDLRRANAVLVTGRHVDNLQGLLKATRVASFDPGPVDGLGGPRTRAAVVAFQRSNSLDPDAIVGPLTWGRLIPFADGPVVALPPDDRRVAAATDATDEFAGLGPQRSLEVLAARVIGEIERRYPDEADAEVPKTTDWVVQREDGTGTVLVRRDSFLDDSVGGYEYAVRARHADDGWVVESATKAAICQRGVADGRCV